MPPQRSSAPDPSEQDPMRGGFHLTPAVTHRVDPGEVLCGAAPDPEKCEEFAEKLRLQQTTLRRS